MNPDVHAFVSIGVIFFAFSCCFLHFKILDRSSVILAVLLFLALITEIVATYCAKTYGNNMPVYNVYSIIELTIISQYFNNINVFKKRRNGYVISVVILFLGIVNCVLLQPILTLNTYFLLFEGFLVIAMCLFAFYKFLLVNENLKLKSYPHFWFTALLLFFWSLTYMYWGLYEVMKMEIQEYMWLPNLALLLANIIMYGGIALVFIFYKRLKQNE